MRQSQEYPKCSIELKSFLYVAIQRKWDNTSGDERSLSDKITFQQFQKKQFHLFH